VTVSSNDASVKAASVAIPGGQSSQSFTLTTAAVNATRTVSITAGYAGATQTVPLTVTPAAAATLAGLTISPSQVNGGSSAQGTVTLSAPAGNGGMRVDLQSSVETASLTVR
jgi:hypothetical protein